MRRHAKAPSAGSILPQASGLGAIIRGAFATRGASRNFDGSGAASGSGLRRPLGASALTIVFVLLFASKALAASAPSVDDTYATEVITKEGKLHAEINPNEAETTYQFQYVDGAHYQPLATDPYEEGEVAPASAQSIGSGTEDVKVSREIEGLTPGTLYHYRVVATNAEGTTNGPDHAIRTFRPFSADSECANQGLRYGAAVNLPDCRAYEMVSPVDKNGGDIRVLESAEFSYPMSVIQSTLEGEKLAYNSWRAFGDAQSNPASSQYIAQRTGEGWQTHSINPPKEEAFFFGAQFYPEYQGFSEDLCQGWIVPYSEPQLAPGGEEGFTNLYRRDDGLCGPEGIAALLPFGSSPPPSLSPFSILLQGESADGSHAIFTSDVKLSPQGSEGSRQLYESSSPGAAPQFVCILPDGTPFPFTCHAGSGEQSRRRADLSGAISQNGEKVFWTAGGDFTGEGQLYVRINGTQTKDVSKAGEEIVGTSSSFFWGAGSDGSRAIYTTGPLFSSPPNPTADLFAFEPEGDETELIAEGVQGVVGMSKDARQIYFVSVKDLGGAAVEGQSNLYLYNAEGETYTFITTLSPEDLQYTFGTPLNSGSPVSINAFEHGARVSPNGMHLVFNSHAPLTGYDNTDLLTGTTSRQAFVYNAETEELVCASCDPSGARDQQREFFPPNGSLEAPVIPGSETSLYYTRAFSDDGSRLFFTSDGALTPRDTNGKIDVYEWEEAGKGTCTEGDPSFSPNNGGCVYLISSGKSDVPVQFVDASASGDNVFINTLSSLLPQDNGLRDIYDARVEGGFPLTTKVAACEGEACQNAPEAPNDPTPGSSSYNGPGNVSETPAVAKKHRKKHHKRRHTHRRHRANHNRRAGR